MNWKIGFDLCLLDLCRCMTMSRSKAFKWLEIINNLYDDTNSPLPLLSSLNNALISFIVAEKQTEEDRKDRHKHTKNTCVPLSLYGIHLDRGVRERHLINKYIGNRICRHNWVSKLIHTQAGQLIWNLNISTFE